MTRTEAYNELERLRASRLISNIGINDPYHAQAHFIRAMEADGTFDSTPQHPVIKKEMPASPVMDELAVKNPFA